MYIPIIGLPIVLIIARKYDVEYREADTQWMVMPWAFDQLQGAWSVAIDRWDEIVLVDDKLWAATPTGFVSFWRETDGDVYLNTNDLVVVQEPLINGNVCLVTDLTAEDQTIYARCDGNSDFTFEGKFATTASTSTFIPLDTDPFASQVLIVDWQDQENWTWLLKDRVGADRGQLVLSMLDQDMILQRGQFEFDAVNALEMFWDDRLEFTTESSGWYTVPRTWKNISELSRPIELDDPLPINHITTMFEGQQQELCLSTAQNAYFSLSTNRVREERQLCADFLGMDNLWFYTRVNEYITITSMQSFGHAERELIDGRFNDDRLNGVPAISQDRRYWFPTQAGVLAVDPDLSNPVLYGGPFAGLVPDAVPSAIIIGADQVPAYWGGDNLYTLNLQQNPLIKNSTLSDQITTPVSVINCGQHGELRLRLGTQERYGWAYLDLESSVLNMNQIGIADLSKHFKEKYGQLQGEFPTMNQVIIDFTAETINFTFPDLPVYKVKWPDGFSPIEVFVADKRILMFGPYDLWEINLETVMTKAADQAR